MPRKRLKAPKVAGSIRARPKQFEMIVAAMEEKPYLNSTTTKYSIPMDMNSTPYSCVDKMRAWEALKVKLNSSGGATKSITDWKKTWCDKKFQVKARARAFKEALQAGAQIEPSDALDPLDLRIAAIIGELVVKKEPADNKESITLLDTSNIVWEDSVVDSSDGADDISELLRMPGIAREMAVPLSNTESKPVIKSTTTIKSVTPADVEMTLGSSRCTEPLSDPLSKPDIKSTTTSTIKSTTPVVVEMTLGSSKCTEPLSKPDIKSTTKSATPANVEMTLGSSRCTEPSSIPGPSMPTEPLQRPSLRSFRRKTTNLFLKNSSVDTICRGTVAMAEAFGKCASALERANELEEQKQERRAAHNAALLELKRLKVEALQKIAASLNNGSVLR